MKVPFLDLHAQHRPMKRDLIRAISQVIERGDFILGAEVKLFEKEFARSCGARYAVGVSSGTDALFLALKSLGVREGDEVIVPVFTFIATAFAVSYTGARPVFVDIDERTYNIDPRKIRQAITKRTKAIVPVHLFGQPANMPEITKIAHAHNLKVVEDAAQAHGAALRTPSGMRQAGAIGDIGCFSFYPTKNLGGMGDGGMLLTNDEHLYADLCVLRDCGRLQRRYEHVCIGYNARLDTLQAALLRPKLQKLKAWNLLRQKAARRYTAMLKGVSGVTLPYTAPGVRHAYHVYAIRVRERDRIFQRLQERGIGAGIFYPLPLHLQKAYAHFGYRKGDFPVAERVAQEILAIPIYPHITAKQIRYVVAALKEELGS